MSITSHIDTAKDLTTFTVTGVLSFDEVMPEIEAFHTGEPTKHVIWDLLAATDVQFTSEQVERVATYQPPYDGKKEAGKSAIVAREDFLFGLSRMFETQNNLTEAPYTVMVFRSIDEAYQWLDLPKTLPVPIHK